MANNKYTYQQKYNVSVSRDALKKIAEMELSKKEYKVMFLLLTELDGFNKFESYAEDPNNFTKVHFSQMAKTLGMKKKEIEKIILHFENLDLIEKGSNKSVTDGYRFLF